MAVILDIIQSGGTSAKLSVSPADTLVFELANTVESDVLANIVAGLQALSNIAGVTVNVNTTGGAS